jgi:hypothetical protein
MNVERHLLNETLIRFFLSCDHTERDRKGIALVCCVYVLIIFYFPFGEYYTFNTLNPHNYPVFVDLEFSGVKSLSTQHLYFFYFFFILKKKVNK